VIKYVPIKCFTKRFRSAVIIIIIIIKGIYIAQVRKGHKCASVSVLVGPCCPALLNCIDVDVYKALFHHLIR